MPHANHKAVYLQNCDNTILREMVTIRWGPSGTVLLNLCLSTLMKSPDTHGSTL